MPTVPSSGPGGSRPFPDAVSERFLNVLRQDYDNPRVRLELPEEFESLWKSEGRCKKTFTALYEMDAS